MKYPVLPGLTPDGTVYENPAMGTVEAMLPPGPYATAHAPTLLELETAIFCARGLPAPTRAAPTSA